MSKNIASDSEELLSGKGLSGVFETREIKMSSSAEPATHESSAGRLRPGSSSEEVGTLEMGQTLGDAVPGTTIRTDLRRLSPLGQSIVSQLPPSHLKDILSSHAKSVGTAAAVFAQSSGSGVYYAAPTVDESDGKTLKAETKGDGRMALAGTLLDRSTNSNITLMSGAEKAEQLQNLRAEADFFSSKKCYEDNGKTCAVILNYLFHGWDGIDPRYGADKDTFTLEDLFADMGIDKESMFSFRDHPYEKVKKLLNEVIQTVNGGGYTSLIVAIGTHGGSTVNSLIVNQSEPRRLVEIDLYEHIVYVLSKELSDIPQIFLVQACRNSKKNQIEKVPIDTSNVIRKEGLQEVCVVRATIPNRFAWRDTDKGSYFFLHLDSVLRERGMDRRLRKVVLEVGERTARLPENKTQIPHIEGTPCTKEYKFKNPKRQRN